VKQCASLDPACRYKRLGANDATKREVLAGVFCNLKVEGGHIGSYQWKGPLEVLEMDSERAFISKWSG
jgi:hypothetical protein